MKTQVLKAENFESKQWSGGTTTQLFIHPPTADYRLKNFDFRLSTATVETETSEFTQLPGFARKLMVLAGATTLQHQNGRSIALSKFDVDAFDGAEKTTSAGRCTDFNVMTKAGHKSSLFGLTLKQDAIYQPIIEKNSNFFFVYAFAGCAQILCGAETFDLDTKDLFVAQKPSMLHVKAIQNCALVFVELQSITS